MPTTRAQDEALGSPEAVRETLNDVAEDDAGTVGSIPERVIDRQLTAARVHADAKADAGATKAQLTELVIAKAALGVAGSDTLTKQKQAEGESITWDVDSFKSSLEARYQRALEDTQRFWAVSL